MLLRLLLSHGIALFCCAYTLGDRLLLEINNHSYTQRQLEAHMLVRNALRIDQPPPEQAISVAAQWRTLLDTFREDMLILLELERYDRYPPSAAEVAKAQLFVLQRLSRARGELTRLGIDAAMLTELVIANLKIAAYRNSRERKTAATKPRWLQKIEQKSFVRFYRGSSIWQPIHPQAGAAQQQ